MCRKHFYFFVFLTLFISCSLSATAQLISQKKEYTQSDTLRGSLRPERTCYDVLFYDLAVDLNIASKTIKGENNIQFNMVNSADIIQLDLSEKLSIDALLFEGKELAFKRIFNAVFVTFPTALEKNKTYNILVKYSGPMLIAVNPPWDGGFSISKDKNGMPLVGISCEGLGASSWWPCKDHLSDEPQNGMRMSYTVPKDLQCIGNGVLEKEYSKDEQTKTFVWAVHYPINSYNVTFYAGDYTHLHDNYTALDGDTLSLDYYVLPYNVDKAKKQFEQVKPMLKCYEKYLGKYPFWQDGYALVETNYLGMEHQSAIAYGNRYLKGYAGHDFSKIGLDFDYIIIHETGHEWWGNSVSCNDIADMWIHESFCTYSEAIYVECMFGYSKAMEYINAKIPSIGNNAPIQGPYGVNEEGDGDMYNKGMLMLNTFRTIFNDDEKWWNTIRSISDTTFKMKNIDAKDIIQFMSKSANKDLSPIFAQYLQHSAIPELSYKIKKAKGTNYKITYQWKVDVANDFAVMPLVYYADGKTNLLSFAADKTNIKKARNKYTTTIQINDFSSFKIATDKEYINLKK